jgi:hypothetical protein
MSIDVALPRVTRFSIGRVLLDSFVIFGRNILLFGGVALVVRLLSLFAPVADFPHPDGNTNWVAFSLKTGLDFVVSGLTEAAIVCGAFQCLLGRGADAGDVAHGMRSAAPIILAGVIYGFPLYAMNVIQALLTENDLVVGILTFTLTVGAIVLSVMWWVYVPAIAIEGKGVFASLGRSAQLTKGRRWAIVGVYLLVMIAAMGPAVLFVATTGWSAYMLLTSPFTLFGAVGYVFYAMTTAFYAVVMTVTYFYLRMEKEGVGVENVARVFD